MTVGDNLGQGTEAAAAMADVAKSAGGPAQQTVSSGDAAPLAVVCGELTSAGSLSDLSLPEQEDQSLQDLIESELALRIAQSEDLDEDSEASEEDGDVNTRFILAERNHSFQTFTGNDTFFFSTLEDTPPSNGDDAVASPPSPCPPVLAAAVFDPFVTTIVDAESSSPSADSEMVCLAHDAAVGDLVDLDLDLDLPEDPAPASNSMLDVADVDVANSLECSVPTNPPVIPEIDVIPPDDDGCCSDDDDYDPEEEEEELVSSGGQRYFEDEPESEWTTVAEAVGPPRDEQDADDANTRFILAERSAWEPDEPADEHRSGIDHDSEIDQGSQIEHVRAVEPEPELELPEVAPEQGPKDLACEVLAEVVDDDSHDSSSSSEDTESDRDGAKDATLKSSKKKRAEGGDVSKTKKSKKTKKGSDQEKENISVITNGYSYDDQYTHHSTNSNSLDDGSDRHVDPLSECPSESTVAEDDLSNVSVRELKSAFTKQARSDTKVAVKELDEDILHCGPILSRKQTYCSEASKSFGGTNGTDKEVIATGISIKELRRSFGDLTKICDDEVEEATDGILEADDERTHGKQRSSMPGGVVETFRDGKLDDGLWKTRSLGDLRPARSGGARLSEAPANLGCELDVFTGVSVKALRASYCSLVHLDDKPTAKEMLKNMKSSFSKFDQLSKKSVLHVRSVDAAKVQKQFNQTAAASPEQATNCRSCGKQVFQMEQVKAERAVWHKNCFRCKECNKQLTLDIYSSHEGQLYCKPHFRELFKPKAVLEDEHEMPSDKPDLGLEELSALNVKSRFQVFEKATEEPAELDRSPSAVNVKRSPSILSKLARFQAKGMDVGVTDESLNGIPFEESSSSSEEEGEDDEGENDKGVVRGSRKQREQPVSFTKMEDMKCRWETGSAARKENLREERKHEISNIRSRLFMGHQGKMKEMYEQAVQESERSAQRKGVDIKSERARSIKEKFERGEVLPDDDPDAAREDATRKAMEEDLSVVEAGISKKSRSLFLELDASAAKNQQPLLPISPVKATPSFREDTRKLFTSRQASEDVVRCSDTVEDVKVETEEVTTKFKFFEGYKPPEKQRRQFRITPPRDGQVKAESPDREIYRDPSVVRCEDKAEDDGELVARSHTTSKMLSLFRQLEENASKEDLPDGPKPLKRFTPPPDCTHESESSEEESDSEDDEDENEEEDERVNPNVVRASDKVEDEFLKQAQNAARAKVLRAKFERWEEKENKANISNTASVNNHVNGVDSERESEHQTSIDTTKSLRARFESLKNETQQPKEKVQRPKVNRFVEIQTSCAEFCSSCEKKVYPLEKVETGGKLFHKQCFRCQQCNCILRMETYTLNGGKPYCLPHFKQLFIAKGNYDEGFGLDQHKRKWRTSSRSDDDFLLNGIDGEASS
ncbi:uncharacterized protein LOC134537607 isoform X4 [Bacillus rossius redtenbacheri]|uniref:uncharacterized protein LOC134537607 isoform X4 n=1 Tax=Bacillus rossius redtenbacheri TaxID=93214 RepID=UPI002FDDD110